MVVWFYFGYGSYEALNVVLFQFSWASCLVPVQCFGHFQKLIKACSVSVLVVKPAKGVCQLLHLNKQTKYIIFFQISDTDHLNKESRGSKESQHIGWSFQSGIVRTIALDHALRHQDFCVELTDRLISIHSNHQ